MGDRTPWWRAWDTPIQGAFFYPAQDDGKGRFPVLEVVRKVLAFFDRRQRIHAGGLLILMVVNGGLEMVGIGLIFPIITVISDPQYVEKAGYLNRAYLMSGTEDVTEFLFYLCAILIAVFILKNLFQLFVHYRLSKFVWSNRARLAGDFVGNYLRLPFSFLALRNSATMVRNVTVSITALFGSVVKPLLQLFGEIVVVCTILILLLTIAPLATIAAVTILGVALFVVQKILRPRFLYWGQSCNDTYEKMIRLVGQTLSGVKEIRVLGRESFFDSAFRRLVSVNSRSSQRYTVAVELPRMFFETVFVVGLFTALMIMLRLNGLSSDVIPVFGLFGMATVRLLPSFNRITLYLSNLRFTRAVLDDLYDDFQMFQVTTKQDATAEDDEISFERDVVFQDVSYVFPTAASPSLEDVSLTIGRGETIGFVGPSGAGKTTLINLLLGLLTPTSGRILVDGKPIVGCRRSWQNKLGLIPQDVFMLDDSFKRNIALGLPDSQIDEDKMRDAINLAQLDGLLAKLPDGLNSPVGERGVRLSGGERQRLAIARALYHDAEVLVMDEATSALDAETETAIIQAINHLKGSRTIITIAHRLSTVRDCDRIYFMVDGRIQDSGSFFELAQRNDDFAGLVRKMNLTTAGS